MTAHSTIDQPRLVLSRQWFDGMQLNTNERGAISFIPKEK